MKIIAIVSLLLLFTFYQQSKSQIYIGGGIDYAIPSGDLSTYNDAALGYSIQIESKKYCKYWFGLKLTHFSFEKSQEFDELDLAFTDALIISPQFRYNFLGDDCYKYEWIPFIHSNLNISSIGHEDKTGRIGLGAGLGLGLGYAFSLFDLCWIAELNASYQMGNAIYKSENRKSFDSQNIAFNISVGL